MPLDLDVVRAIRVNRSAVERRAATPTTERELIALMTEIGNRCVLEARERPLLTMVAAEAAR